MRYKIAFEMWSHIMAFVMAITIVLSEIRGVPLLLQGRTLEASKWEVFLDKFVYDGFAILFSNIINLLFFLQQEKINYDPSAIITEHPADEYAGEIYGKYFSKLTNSIIKFILF